METMEKVAPVEVTHPNYGLSRSKEEIFSNEYFVNPLPRAVLRNNSFLLLDGEWRFSLDPNDEGIRERWYLGHEYTRTAHWPGFIEAHMDDAREHAPVNSWSDNVVAWYERDFPMPQLSPSNPHTMLQLTFGACGYETQVWLNGFPLSTIEGEEKHIGEYTSFSYELNEEVLRPQNRITVRIADTMDADITRGKQESYVYKRGGIWYQTYTGAVRSVWIETVERNRLRSRVSVISSVEEELVRFNFTTRIKDPGEYTLRVKIYEKKKGSNGNGNGNGNGHAQPVAESDFNLRLEAGQKQQRVVVELPGAKLWSVKSPNLYRLVAQLIDSNGYEAQIESHFGLRKIESRGNKVYLNNEPIYIDGILYQPGVSTYEEIKQHMLSMKELGCNLVRIHIAGVDPRIYNMADEMGLLLWVEVPSPHRSNPQSRKNHREELMRMLALIETHPSVVIWSLYNEDWGAQDIATSEETRNYITETYYMMMIHHPQFLVVDNDGWQHISKEGRLKSDLLTAHLYTPDLTRWRELLDKLVGGELTGVAAFPLVVGDPFFYRRQVPLIVSEWGGFGFPDYGGPKDADERTELIRLFKQELRKRPIAGDVYTQATNIEDERNGLIEARTGELKVPAGILASEP